MSHAQTGDYYLPEPTTWPVTVSIGLFLLLGGFAMMLADLGPGAFVMGAGFLFLVLRVAGWFGEVIAESEAGLYNDRVDRSFRMGMIWFIFSEVMFFAAFFGALFYARMYSVPWLGGEGHGALTHELLWPDFTASWPLLHTPDAGKYTQIEDVIPAFGIPLLNTIILLSSGVTVTIAHHFLKANRRTGAAFWQAMTVLLGLVFLYFQATEFHEAYSELGLTLRSGIYGTTFFMLTGFHGAHVTLGTIMLTVILIRIIKGHFRPDRHFAFEAVAWYWHFVDVVWLGLFTFVYWL